MNLNTNFSPNIRDHFPFPTIRPVQETALQAIERGFQNDKKFIILELPTGSGKSPLGVAAASWVKTQPLNDPKTERGAYYLTTQKTLQAQMMRDFANMGLLELKGKANYWCSLFDTDCDTASLLHGGRNKEDAGDNRSNPMNCCSYHRAKRAFIQNPLGTANYAYYLNETQYAGQLKNREMLICDEGHNLENCQPPDTKVQVVLNPQAKKRGGYVPAKTAWKSISELKNGEFVVSWNKEDCWTYMSGREIQVASRIYDGPMLTVRTKAAATRMTPNHFLWVRWNRENTRNKQIVYLMYREDKGFRVGSVRLYNEDWKGFGLGERMSQEKATKGWILRICDSKPEAEAWEHITAITYGIPETMFELDDCVGKEHYQDIFRHARIDGGTNCLRDHGLLETHPILVRETTMGEGWGKRFETCNWKGYFKVAASNLIPSLMGLPKIMKRKGTARWPINEDIPILSVESNPYKGVVHSLNVDEHHTYVADGLIVGNCILGFTDTVINPKRCEEHGAGRIPFIKPGENAKTREWLAKTFVPATQEYMRNLEELMNEAKYAQNREDQIKYGRKLDSTDKFLCRLNRFINSEDPGNWLCWSDKDSNILTIKPLTATLYADEVLFRKARKILIMSATILDFGTFMRNLGIKREDAEILAVPSEFPVENRPIFYRPVGLMSYQHIDKTLPKMAEMVEKIATKYKGKKGLVHSHSFKITKFIVDHLRAKGFGNRLLTHTGDIQGSRDLAVQKHLSSPEDTFIVSPSINEGLDLKEDLGRWQVLTKVMYPALDPYQKARLQLDPAYYNWLTALAIVQATGRCVRSRTDRAHTYILDRNFEYFLTKNQNILPKWWTDSIIW